MPRIGIANIVPKAASQGRNATGSSSPIAQQCREWRCRLLRSTKRLAEWHHRMTWRRRLREEMPRVSQRTRKIASNKGSDRFSQRSLSQLLLFLIFFFFNFLSITCYDQRIRSGFHVFEAKIYALSKMIIDILFRFGNSFCSSF